MFGLQTPNTGMAVTIDLGETSNIHPRSKLEVGRRLARIALVKLYGKPFEYSGPIYTSMTVEGGGIRLSFAHRGGGLYSRDGGELREFQIAGEDGKFAPAQAIIDQETKATVFVWSKDVPTPKYVRYAWRNNPSVNFYNIDGLPASPFRTDKLPSEGQSDWVLPESLKNP
jgi:sialate O-acetylesterase